MAKGKGRAATQVVAVFDTETTNDAELKRSLPVCYQIGECWKQIPEIEPEDVQATVYREKEQAFAHFTRIVGEGIARNVIPVVAVHNLAFDIHFIMEYINGAFGEGYMIEACFKSSIKPLAIKICTPRVDEKTGELEAADPVLIFWDTLSFSGKGLGRMGRECGYLKAEGDWDYDKTRTPATPLTTEEEFYAKQDVIVPFMWLKYWAGLNGEVPLDRFGSEILTKTSVVRHKTRDMGEARNYRDGRGRKRNEYKTYLLTCAQEKPKTAEDYALMIRSTSAGWTFTASEAAGATWENVRKYDATSMHPSHMVSHYYPRNFTRENISKATARRMLREVFETTPEQLMRRWVKPFRVAFNARVLFTNLRPRAGSVFARDGVMLHGSALFKDYAPAAGDLSDESSANEFNRINGDGYANEAVGAVYEFGKLVSAEAVTISLNELNAWVHGQVYEWDAFEVLDASAACRWLAVPDHIVNSVAEMLGRKKTVKDGMHGKKPAERPGWMPERVFDKLEDAEDETVQAFYRQVKADLNSLYGMFATNEYKETIVYGDGDFAYDGVAGFEKEVKHPKAWYNFGLRIAAWSRVQQCIAMQLIDAAGFCERLINGDTDSFAWEAPGACGDAEVLAALRPLHGAIACGIDVCTRRSGRDRRLFDGLGEYMEDCKPTRYCAVANKRYCYESADGRLHAASAGVPNKSVESAIAWELRRGRCFSASVIAGVGYNAGYAPNMSGCKYKAAPRFSERLEQARTVTDYTGRAYTYRAGEQVGIYLAGTVKVLGAGYDADHLKCLKNAAILEEYEPPHFYEDLGGELHKY